GMVFIPPPEDPGTVMKAAFALNPMGMLLNAARAPAMGVPLLAPAATGFWLVFTLVGAALVPALGRRVQPIVVARPANRHGRRTAGSQWPRQDIRAQAAQ